MSTASDMTAGRKTTLFLDIPEVVVISDGMGGWRHKEDIARGKNIAAKRHASGAITLPTHADRISRMAEESAQAQDVYRLRPQDASAAVGHLIAYTNGDLFKLVEERLQRRQNFPGVVYSGTVSADGGNLFLRPRVKAGATWTGELTGHLPSPVDVAGRPGMVTESVAPMRRLVHSAQAAPPDAGFVLNSENIDDAVSEVYDWPELTRYVHDDAWAIFEGSDDYCPLQSGDGIYFKPYRVAYTKF
jgi:hypothetical protein